MLNKQKLYILLLPALLIASLLTGCGTQEESEGAAFERYEVQTVPTTVPTEPPIEPPTTLPPTEPPTTQAGMSIGVQISKETEPAPANDYRTAYKEIVERFEAEELGYYHYDLIYVDEDDVPELVVDPMCCTYLYTYKNGTVYELMDGWSYGAMGNNGYYYIPGTNTLYNYNHDYAGLLGYATYMKIDTNHEIVSDYYIELYHFLDANADGYPDDGEYEAWVEDGEHTIYYLNGTKQLTEEEALSYDPHAENMMFLNAESSYNEILSQLK